MSRNSLVSVSKTKRNRKPDLRVRRTRDALGDALIGLMQEKPFESIQVQHVLDRAGVGRSTFYAHYRDKDDLFLSDLEDFFEMMSTLLQRYKDESDRVAPINELFTHLAEMHQLHSAFVAADKMHDFVEMGQGYFARSIEQRLAHLSASRGIDHSRLAAMAHAFAGSMFSLMTWWIQRRTSDVNSAPTPEEMDTLFHQTVWSGIAGDAGSRDRFVEASSFSSAGAKQIKARSVSRAPKSNGRNV
jgi:AcrR family transcriptional regulator